MPFQINVKSKPQQENELDERRPISFISQRIPSEIDSGLSTSVSGLYRVDRMTAGRSPV